MTKDESKIVAPLIDVLPTADGLSVTIRHGENHQPLMGFAINHQQLAYLASEVKRLRAEIVDAELAPLLEAGPPA